MTTPEQAAQTARAYVAANQPGHKVASLLEDDTDFLVVVETVPPGGPCPVGQGSIFVRKSDGTLYFDNVVYVLDKVDAMIPVTWNAHEG